MKIDGSKILVIGGAGFIGSFVVSEVLKTNVANETKSKWLNRISKSMYWELEYNLT